MSTQTLCSCLHPRSSHSGNFKPPGDPEYLPTICGDKAIGSNKFGSCPCERMDVRGTCECGHDAKQHENIDARFELGTPCTSSVLGPTSFSGNIVRTMRCTCSAYTPKVMVPTP